MLTEKPDATVDLADIFEMAADHIESRVYHNFVGGPNLWSALHMVVWDLVTGPASEQLQHMVGVAQLQHWHGAQEEAVELLRKAAGNAGQLPVLREDYATHRLERARQAMLAAMGWEGSNSIDLGGISRAMADEIKRLRKENERLAQEIRAIRSR
ncbi:hypothetical protein [Nonomuraea sp. NPDC050643]|uniref:hypothetical protein n=1 Tax=Nonomuraea sp. NPDC050643 TaxID=3155660 RepID=UPI003403DF73